MGTRGMTRRVVRVLSFEGCPHASSARAAARTAIEESSLSIDFVEVDLLDPTIPSELRRYPSPTVLVGSVDAAGPVEASGGVGCRSSGAPSVQKIRQAIQALWGSGA